MTDASMPEANEQDLTLAQATLQDILTKMNISATIAADWGEPDEDGLRTLQLDVQGDDLSLLIGRKGEALAALQYMTRLIIGKHLRQGVNLVVDVEGFRRRRQEQLRRMARRLAEQVVQRGRAMSLEPMPPDERRIVHIELRDHPQVRTESVGEGSRRKVTIIPK
jgi:spoIIIJ-associated protein